MARPVSHKCEFCGLFYDESLYTICPHCNGNASENQNEKQNGNEKQRGNDEIRGENKPEKEKSGLFSWKDKKKSKTEEEKSVPSDDFKINTEPLMEDDFKTVQEMTDLDEEAETPPMILPEENNIIKPVIPMGPGVVRPQPHIAPQVVTPSPVVPSSVAPSPITSGSVNPVPVNRGPIVREAINNSNDEMRTVMQFDIERPPVVGWLICVKGECQGRSFEICSGNNTLGRNSDNDIVIDDSTVSREQAIIIFEPRKQNFFLKPKDNSQFMYTNDEEIADRIQLTPYMHIEIGEKTEFIFVPFCGENFNWKEYIEE